MFSSVVSFRRWLQPTRLDDGVRSPPLSHAVISLSPRSFLYPQTSHLYIRRRSWKTTLVFSSGGPQQQQQQHGPVFPCSDAPAHLGRGYGGVLRVLENEEKANGSSSGNEQKPPSAMNFSGIQEKGLVCARLCARANAQKCLWATQKSLGVIYY